MIKNPPLNPTCRNLYGKFQWATETGEFTMFWPLDISPQDAAEAKESIEIQFRIIERMARKNEQRLQQGDPQPATATDAKGGG